MFSAQNIGKKISEAGIKPSLQRIKIYEFLLKNNIHPTVDFIYNQLVNDIPTLSKTTVYNTLKLFEKQGLIINLIIDENEIRYDAMKNIHGHFKCDKCGKIYDFEYNHMQLEFLGLNHFNILKTELNLKGTCPECN
jgi:Fe2+ or Zn2+ uptake regulation protein